MLCFRVAGQYVELCAVQISVLSVRLSVGTLVGWDLHDEEETPPTAQDHHLSYMPKCVYVQFYDEDVQGTKTPCTWTVGSLAPGVYPIDPDRQDWYVDGDKQNRVARRQFPLSPHFANTVYSSQGLTIGTGVVDLKVGRNTDSTTLYVAISRFRRADDLLILQPFDKVLQQGEPAQATFLLEHLELMATQKQDEARQRADAYGEQVRAQRTSKRTADRRLSENLSEETRDAQRRRLEENVGDMSAEARERQQGGLTAANKARRSTNRMTAKCGECGERKISDDYTRRQW